MTSFCLLLLGALASFIISRMCKSASLYVFLVCVLLLGFVVGTGVKKVVANTSNTPSQELVVTMAPNPTSQGSTAFVGTVDNQSYEMGQEDGGPERDVPPHGAAPGITAAAPVRTSPNLSDPFRSSGPSRTSPALIRPFPNPSGPSSNLSGHPDLPEPFAAIRPSPAPTRQRQACSGLPPAGCAPPACGAPDLSPPRR